MAPPEMLCSLAESGNIEQLSIHATVENCGLATADGLTPLMCAAKAAGRPQVCHESCAALLLTLADGREAREQLVTAVDRYGWSCLHHAAAVDNVGVAEKLLLAGARVNQVDGLGMSPVAVAVERASARTVDLLMRVGADPLLANKQGLSPLGLAKEANGDRTMARRLERWLPAEEIRPDFQEVDKRKRKLIASGEFADVFETQTKPPTVNVVLRVLRRDDRVRGQTALRVKKQELEALKKVRHVNIVQLIKYEVSERSIEVFLERIEGSNVENPRQPRTMSIKQLLESNGPIVEVQIQKYFRQLASALCYLHNHPSGPIIHRNIRCENIMLAADGVLKLTDFGATTAKKGVYSCMAPEIVGTELSQYSRKSDIWAAGCVLYAMAIGDYAFIGENPISIGLKIMGPLPELVPQQKFSTSLRDLYLKCMEKDPDNRIDTVGMLLHGFLNWNTEHDNDILRNQKQDIEEWTQKGEAAIALLGELVQNINQSYKKEVAAKIGTTAAAIGGGITAIVGFVLLIPSFGAALPLVIAGTAVAIAGGVGSATADVAGTVVQRKEFAKSQEKISEFKKPTQILLLDSLKSICSSVQLHVADSRSAIDLTDSSVLIRRLKVEIERIQDTLVSTEMMKNIPDEQRQQLVELFDSWLSPVNELLKHLAYAETLVNQRRINREASNQFNRGLQKATDFAVRMLRILMLGSAEEPSDFYLAQVKSGLRSVAGGAQLGLEIGSAAGRTVLGRIFGVVGAAVFTAVDIGFLAYYSVRLHRAKDGANAEKADPIACQMEIFRLLLREAEELHL